MEQDSSVIFTDNFEDVTFADNFNNVTFTDNFDSIVFNIAGKAGSYNLDYSLDYE